MPLKSRSGKTLTLGLVEMGRFSRTAARVVAANVQAVLGLDVDPLEPLDVVGEAFQERRRQYDAGLILKHVSGRPCPEHRSVLVLTEVDLCSPILTYVYGEAELGGRLAIVSICRLGRNEDGTRVSAALLHERLAKVALHEVAHTLSLYHCETSGCLMRFSPGIRHLDAVDLFFCPRCDFILKNTLEDSSLRR